MNSSGNPCILNANSFPAVCMAEYPITWPVSQFYGEVTSPASRLQALLKAPVTDITVYHRPGGPVTHDYLIMCIRPMEPVALGGFNRLWARCERNPGSIPGGAAKLFRGPAPALDTIRFSVDRPKLRAEGDNAIMECAYDALRVEHVSDLLMIIHEVSPQYGLASYNCWWFSAVAIGTLQVLGSDWTIKPSRDWAKKAVQALGRSTRDGTQGVTTRFADRWHSGVLPTVPITNDLAWEGSVRLPAANLVYDTLNSPENAAVREVRRGELTGSTAHSVPLPTSHPNRPRVESRTTYPYDSLGQGLHGLRSFPPELTNLDTTIRRTPPPRYQILADDPVLDPRSRRFSSSDSRDSVMEPASSFGFRDSLSPPSNSSINTPTTAYAQSFLSNFDSAGVTPYGDGFGPGVFGIDTSLRGSSISSRSAYSPAPSPISDRVTRMNSHASDHSTLATNASATFFEDGTTLDALVWRVLWSRDHKDLQVLLAIHLSFTTSSELLREFKMVFQNTPPINERAQWIRPRILGVLDQWLNSDYFDLSLGSELQGFLMQDVRADPGFQNSPQVQSMLGKLEQMLSNIGDLTMSMSSMSLQNGARLLERNVNSLSRGSQRTLKTDSMVKMKDKDLAELALSLEIMEIEMRSQLTLARVVRWLRWRRTPDAQSPTARPFSPLSDKIAAWVVDTCLQGSLDHRAQTLSKFVTLADRCRENGNLASLSDLLYGLRSPAIERLQETRRLSRGTDGKLSELMQLIHPRTPHHLFPSNPRMLAFVPPFNNTVLETGLISWSRCQNLYDALAAAVTIPSTLQLPQVHQSYSIFLAMHIQTASQNARNHHAISQRISGEERRERVALERSAAGLRAR